MCLAGCYDLFVAEGRPQVDVAHFLHRHTAAHTGVGCGAHCSTRVSGGRLHEEFPDLFSRNNFLVEFYVECAATGEHQASRLANNIPQVVIHQVQADVLKQLLHGRRIVNIGIIGRVTAPPGAQPLDQLR